MFHESVSGENLHSSNAMGNEGEAAAMRMHPNASDITAAERKARVVKQSRDAWAPPGPETTDKSIAFINGALICVRYMTAGICRTSTIKSTSAKLAACQSQRKAAKGLDFAALQETPAAHTCVAAKSGA